MKNAHVGTEHRDAYWEATREQLKSAQKRADQWSLLGLGAICVLLWIYHEPGDGFGQRAIVGIALALIAICLPLWFVTRRKRDISAERGLTCPHCGWVPHDTEIVEVAQTRQCPRCEQSLD
jgi:hypothetical protein